MVCGFFEGFCRGERILSTIGVQLNKKVIHVDECRLDESLQPRVDCSAIIMRDLEVTIQGIKHQLHRKMFKTMHTKFQYDHNFKRYFSSLVLPSWRNDNCLHKVILRWSTFLLMLLNAWVLKPIVYARAVQPRVERTDASSVTVRSLRGVNPNVGEVATALVYPFWNYLCFSPYY